ncbi:MAG: DUF72 domain-containing protein [Candidatus Heimdallarchaeota archaeon]|nr:DUF72 domain-containing protein [Candidatus Heimdallarchaeota archaeon]
MKSFYPTDDESQWLSYYAKRSSFAEIRTTYTRVLPPEIINHWVSNTKDDFIFSASMNKQVTHDKKNEIQKDDLAKFFDMLEPLGNKLGVVLLHFPNHLLNNEQNLAFVIAVIDACREYFNGYLVIDISNRSWFTSEVNEIFVKKDACLLNNDRRAVGSSMNNPEIYYLKLAGDTRLIPKKDFGTTYFPRDRDIKHWSSHLKFKAKRHKKIFVSFDNHFSGDSTKDAYMMSNALKDMKIKFTGFNDR